jgi:hypothetical protein
MKSEGERQWIIDNIMINIPDFIDTKVDKKLWNILYSANLKIMDLMCDYVLGEEEFEDIVSDYLIYLDMISYECNLDKMRHTSSIIYLLGVIEVIKGRCLDEELYESLANIKRFEDII